MLYSLTLYPIELLLETFLVILVGLTSSYFFAIILLAILVKAATKPLEALTAKAVATQAEMETVLKPQLDDLKQSLSGARQHEAITRLYRRYSYHPVFAVRSLLQLLVQLPFFIAAYYMLSDFEGMSGVSIPLFGDLAGTDSLLPGGFHLAPVLMTVINILAIYTRAKSKQREKTQGLVLAALFLVLLYEAPLGLIVYWTANNCLSLLSNFYPAWLPAISLSRVHAKFRRSIFGQLFEEYGYLFLVTNLAILLPLLGVLGSQFNLFTAHAMDAKGILILFLSLMLMPAAVLAVLRWCFKNKGLSVYFDGFTLTLFLGVFLFYLFNKAGYGLLNSSLEPLVLLVLAALVTLTVTASLLKAKALKPLAYLSLLVPVLFLHFVYVSPASTLFKTSNNLEGLSPEGFNDTPVFVLVFDEFSGLTLQDGSGALDAERYPDFAELMQNADYYPNALTTGYHTDVAVPSIVSGTRRTGPNRGLAPGENLIELFQTWGDGVHAHSAVLPADLMSEQDVATGIVWSDMLTLYLHIISHQDWIESKIGAIPSTWRDFGVFHSPQEESTSEPDQDAARYPSRLDFFGDWMQKLRLQTNVDQFNFVHMVFPHVPYDFTAMGRLQENSDRIRQQLTAEEAFQAEQSFLNVGYHNYLQQSAYAGSLLKDLVRVLKDTGQFDRSLIIVTADHGVSYIAEGLSRRDPFTKDSWKNIMSVPLFVKNPYQSAGRVDKAFVTTLDIAPTIMDAVGVSPPWSLAGESLKQEGAAIATKSVQLVPGYEEFFAEIEQDFSESRSRKELLFGSKTPVTEVAVNYTESPSYDALLGANINDLASAESDKTVIWGGSIRARELSNFGKVFQSQIPQSDVVMAAVAGETIQAVFRSGAVDGEAGNFAFSMPETEEVPTQFEVTLYEVAGSEEFVLRPIQAFSSGEVRFQSKTLTSYDWENAVVRTNGIDSLDVDSDGMSIRSSSSNDPYFVMQAISDQPVFEPTILIELNSNKELLLQLFYQTVDEGGFSEARSQTYPVSAGDNDIFIQLPATQISGEFRIDLGFGDETAVDVFNMEVRQ